MGSVCELDAAGVLNALGDFAPSMAIMAALPGRGRVVRNTSPLLGIDVYVRKKKLMIDRGLTMGDVT